MALIKHIAARQKYRARHRLIIIRDQKPPFTRINVLIGLGRIAPHKAMPTRGCPPPMRTHRVRAIFNHPHPMGPTKRHQLVHIAHVAAHMRQKQGFSARCMYFLRQIHQIDGQIGRHFDKDGPGPHGCNRTWHGCKSKTV